jgi:thioredoxin-like negative regulator of GroEL
MQAVIAVVLLAIAAGVALWLERRRHATALPTPATAPVPQQLQRADFARPDAPWLVVLFSSSTCDGCKPMAEKVRALESTDVAVVEVEYSSDPELHARYGIEAVPIVVVADHEGVTRTSFAGTATATDLWAAVAELRA